MFAFLGTKVHNIDVVESRPCLENIVRWVFDHKKEKMWKKKLN